MPNTPTYVRQRGTALTDTRKARGLTVDALANTSGVSRSMIYAVESGARGIALGFARKIADALAVPVGEVFEHANGSLLVDVR